MLKRDEVHAQAPRNFALTAPIELILFMEYSFPLKPDVISMR